MAYVRTYVCRFTPNFQNYVFECIGLKPSIAEAEANGCKLHWLEAMCRNVVSTDEGILFAPLYFSPLSPSMRWSSLDQEVLSVYVGVDEEGLSPICRSDVRRRRYLQGDEITAKASGFPHTHDRTNDFILP